eukprot:52384-Hanusia_phi.AAC.1
MVSAAEPGPREAPAITQRRDMTRNMISSRAAANLGRAGGHSNPIPSPPGHRVQRFGCGPGSRSGPGSRRRRRNLGLWG